MGSGSGSGIRGTLRRTTLRYWSLNVRLFVDTLVAFTTTTRSEATRHGPHCGSAQVTSSNSQTRELCASLAKGEYECEKCGDLKNENNNGYHSREPTLTMPSHVYYIENRGDAHKTSESLQRLDTFSILLGIYSKKKYW